MPLGDFVWPIFLLVIVMGIFNFALAFQTGRTMFWMFAANNPERWVSG